jgi:hypothetical protein
MLAWLHVNDAAVCEMSKGLPMEEDYHDYQDSDFGFPIHFDAMTCRRCGKEFII